MSDTPASAFTAYIKAFETLDPEVAVPFYHVPALFVAPQGVFAAPDANAARALLTQYMDQLRSQSYRRTDVHGLKVSPLSSGLANCSGVFVRFNASGAEIARLGFTYTMRESGGSWKIVVAIVHDPVARYYHGTRAKLRPGDLIQAGYASNYTEQKSSWVYFSETLNAAAWGAELAKGEGPGRIYEVEPIGPFADDPDLTDKKFPGNATKSYRSSLPLRVVEELLGWQGHSPEEIQAMKAGIAGKKPIND
jgi:hypothetical protein